MDAPRSPAEKKYIKERLDPILEHLRADQALMAEFLAFAAKCGVPDVVKFSKRFSNTLHGGRPPSTYTALVLVHFADERGILRDSRTAARRAAR